MAQELPLPLPQEIVARVLRYLTVEASEDGAALTADAAALMGVARGWEAAAHSVGLAALHARLDAEQGCGWCPPGGCRCEE